MKKRLLSALLVACMLLAMIPVSLAATPVSAPMSDTVEGQQNEGSNIDTPSGEVEPEVDTYVATIGESQYTTLQQAVDQVADNEKIALLADCSETVTVSRSVVFTLDVGEHSFTGSIEAGEGYKLTETDGAYTVTPEEGSGPSDEDKIVASIGQTGYRSYEEALEAAGPDDTVVIWEKPETLTVNQTVTLKPIARLELNSLDQALKVDDGFVIEKLGRRSGDIRYLVKDIKNAHTITIEKEENSDVWVENPRDLEYGDKNFYVPEIEGANDPSVEKGTLVAFDGEDVTLAFEPAPGYRIVNVSVDGEIAATFPEKEWYKQFYTLENVTEDHTISFTCEAVPEDAMDDDCVVTLIQPKYGGTITVENPDIVVGEDGTFTVPAGTTVNFTFTPEPGFANRYYVFDNTWYAVKYAEEGKPETYTRLTEIHGNHMVTAEFADSGVVIDPNFEYITIDLLDNIGNIAWAPDLASLDGAEMIPSDWETLKDGDRMPVRKGDDLNLIISNYYDKETEIMYIPYEVQLDGEKVPDFSPNPFETANAFWTLKDVSEAHTVSIKYKDASQGGTEEPDEPSGGDDNNKPSGGSGGSSSGSSTTYTAKVNKTGSGSAAVSPQNAKKGDKVTVTATPNAGYEVAAVTVTDSSGKTVAVSNEGNGKYTFTQPASRVTVQVTFRVVEEQPDDTAMPFTDVAAGQWYAEAVQYVYEKGLMTGTSATAFAPDATTTRGMIVTMLYRLEGEPAAAASGFADVEAGQWYANAVNWAAANQIVNGYGETFGPNDIITREQMAAILYRYAQYKGYDVSASGQMSAYTDAANVSDYASSAMQWAVGEGLLNGVTETTLAPDGSAIRAQVAAIFMRFCENVAK